MSICGEWSLRRDAPTHVDVATLLCNAWTCPQCRSKRRRRLMAEAARGNPNRFLTLTCNPRVGASPEERRSLMGKALATLAKRLRRRYGPSNFEYFVVCESTVLGEPHLHVLVRSPFIPQKLLSSAWRQLMGAPIVDIRKVKDRSKAVTYVAKYVSKSPEHFGFSKRYWQSGNYQLEDGDQYVKPAQPSGKVIVERRTLGELCRELTDAGYPGRKEGDRWIRFFKFHGLSP